MKKKLILSLVLIMFGLPTIAKSEHLVEDLKLGISQADVEEIMGKPSAKTIDSESKQVWIYDKRNIVPIYDSSKFGADIGNATVVLKFDDYQILTNIAYQKIKYREKK